VVREFEAVVDLPQEERVGGASGAVVAGGVLALVAQVGVVLDSAVSDEFLHPLERVVGVLLGVVGVDADHGDVVVVRREVVERAELRLRVRAVVAREHEEDGLVVVEAPQGVRLVVGAPKFEVGGVVAGVEFGVGFLLDHARGS
jgi:hypothetical protein